MLPLSFRYQNVIALLQAALPFWPRARYSSARYGHRSDMDNRPTDDEGLKKAVEEVSIDTASDEIKPNHEEGMKMAKKFQQKQRNPKPTVNTGNSLHFPSINWF